MSVAVVFVIFKIREVLHLCMLMCVLKFCHLCHATADISQ